MLFYRKEESPLQKVKTRLVFPTRFHRFLLKGLVIVSVEGHAADGGFSRQYFIVRKNEVHAIDSRIGRVE